MPTLAIERRRNLLLVITGLVVAYVRNAVQYRHYTFQSAWEFFGFWAVHYFAVAIGAGVFYASVRAAGRLLLGARSSEHELTINEAIVYFSLAILTCSIAVFVLAHWPHHVSAEE